MSLDARYEIKCVGNATDYASIRQWLCLQPMVFRSPYPARVVNSIYWDCADASSFQDHILGALERVKVRYRWYGRQWGSPDAQLEIKTKRGQLSYKQVFPLSVGMADGMAAAQLYASLWSGLPDSARLYLQTRSQAVLLNHYQREYWQAGPGLRVTLDRNMVACDLRLGSAIRRDRSILLPDSMILEIKCDQAHYDQACELLAAMPLRQQRHSKYVTGFLNMAFYS